MAPQAAAANRGDEFAGRQEDEDDEQSKTPLSKTIGNVMNLVSDGLYRIKNRAKAE